MHLLLRSSTAISAANPDCHWATSVQQPYVLIYTKMHSPDDCCICSNQRHPIAQCWHIIGLPVAKVHMLEQFKAQQASGAGPWSAQSVKALTVEPQVAPIASVQTPDPTLCTSNLNKSGVILNKAKGDLLDVKEMDHNYSHGFKSSFLLHHLTNNPTVSAIPEYFNGNHNALNMIRLLDDSPEVAFVSRVQWSNTVLAHKDMGATVWSLASSDGPEVAFVSHVQQSDTVLAHVDTGATVWSLMSSERYMGRYQQMPAAVQP
jgi:hypothetical protein